LQEEDSCVEDKSLEEQEDSSAVAQMAAAAVNLHHDVNNITLNYA